jgi:hypothetical protein
MHTWSIQYRVSESYRTVLRNFQVNSKNYRTREGSHKFHVVASVVWLCIDEMSNIEFKEAINSMFGWCQGAKYACSRPKSGTRRGQSCQLTLCSSRISLARLWSTTAQAAYGYPLLTLYPCVFHVQEQMRSSMRSIFPHYYIASRGRHFRCVAHWFWVWPDAQSAKTNARLLTTYSKQAIYHPPGEIRAGLFWTFKNCTSSIKLLKSRADLLKI